MNPADYLKAKTEYPLENDVIEELLQSSLSEQSKFAFCYDIDSSFIESESNLMTLASKFFVEEEFNLEEIDRSLVELAFFSAPHDQVAIQILCKMIPVWNEPKIMQLLSELGANYKKIAAYGSRVKIKSSDEHRKLALLLDKHNYISSTYEEEGYIRFNTKKSAN